MVTPWPACVHRLASAKGLGGDGRVRQDVNDRAECMVTGVTGHLAERTEGVREESSWGADSVSGFNRGASAAEETFVE
jgi:hypothetical protein